jgi:hypothetical protein
MPSSLNPFYHGPWSRDAARGRRCRRLSPLPGPRARVRAAAGAAGMGGARPGPRAAWPRRLPIAGRLHLLKQVHGTRVLARAVGGPAGGDAAQRRSRRDHPRHRDGRLPARAARDPGRRARGRRPRRWRGTAAGRDAGGGGRRSCGRVAPRGPRGRARAPHRSLLLRGGRRAARAFGRGGDAFFRPGPAGPAHLTCAAANVAQLARGGSAEARSITSATARYCRADLYHSYRRGRRARGRMISYVGWAAAAGRPGVTPGCEALSSSARLARRSAVLVLLAADVGQPELLEAARRRVRLAVERDSWRVLHAVGPATSAHHQLGVGEDVHPARAPAPGA